MSPEELEKIRDAAFGALRKMADCSVAFLKIIKNDIVPIGSGTLVRIGKTRGILTAAHVWKVVEQQERVGFYVNAYRRTEIQSSFEDTDKLVAKVIGDSTGDEMGPDIAFLKLSDLCAATLEMLGTFLNADRHQAVLAAQTSTPFIQYDAVVGIVAEWEPSVTMRGKSKVIKLEALTNIGSTSMMSAGHGGCDRLEFTPVPEPGFVLPKSYGGVSGGGLFRVVADREMAVAVALHGVAYWETEKDSPTNKIVCHGPQTIYETLVPSIKQRWP